MAKTFSADLQEHYEQSTTTLSMFWRVARQDGQVFGWVDHDVDIPIAGVTYRASEGLQTSTVKQAHGFAVGSMDVTAFLDVSTEAEIEAGIWEESRVTIFEARWDEPPTALDPDKVNFLREGFLGRIDRENLKFTAEVRDLAMRLETRFGRLYSPGCPWRHALWNGTTFEPEAVCAADLTGKIHTGTVTGLGDDPRMVFAVDLVQAAGYYNEGVLAMTSGDNAGLGKLSSMDIRRWENGIMTLHRPLPYAVEVGDTLTVSIGDDKTWATCRATFSNGRHFGGMPYLPGIDAVLENPLLKVPLPPRPAPPDGNPEYDGNLTGTDSAEGGSVDAGAGE